MRKAIIDKNRINNKARMVAGYCWDWSSKKKENKNDMDIIIPEYRFEAQWNLNDDGSLWLIAENSVEQIGCIHTSQGLELDYIGVIIGDDFVIRDGKVMTDALKRSRNDRSVLGIKKRLKEDANKAKKLADEIIKNTYRTLMTRGQKGCFIFCTDQETREYFKQVTDRNLGVDETAPESDFAYKGIEFPIVSYEDAKPYQGFVPIYDLEIAAGGFSEQQAISNPDELDWVQLPEHINTTEGMFVTRVVGESMNKRIINGSWCLFKANPGGSRNGKVVLVQHHSIEDPDHGGTYTVKRYESEKMVEEGELVNQRVLLKPETNAYGYSPIVIEEGEELVVVGEFLQSI